MDLIQAIVMGVVEGLTEFIPVSSTAHLLITQTLLNIQPSPVVTIFNIVVQMGAIAALIIYFWQDLFEIAKTTLANLPNVFAWQRLPQEARLGWFIVIASIPALASGYLLRHVVEAFFQHPIQHAAVRLLTAGVIMALAEWLGGKKREIGHMTLIDSIVVGVFQVLAVFPGASRSGSTISGGLFAGLTRKAAARFAMLISVPVMLAAGIVEGKDLFTVQGGSEALVPVMLGTIVAGVVGWLAIRWLLNYLQKHSLYVFSAYCLLAGAACFVFSWMG